MLLTLDGEGPLYLQIYQALKQQILTGRLNEGEKLPASRFLASQLAVSRNVVLLAYDQLKAEGFICGRVGAGTRVAPHLSTTDTKPAALTEKSRASGGAVAKLTEQANIALTHWQARSRPWTSGTAEPTYDFRYGDVEVDPLSERIWRRLSGQALARHEFQYGHPQGDAALRESIAAYVNAGRGCDCTAEQVCIVNGSQQALDILARMFISPGTPVMVEEPGYLGARIAFQAAGARIVPVPVDAEGIRVARLPRVGKVQSLIYVTPSHQFPTGSILSLPRRLALLEWAERHDSYIVEDDYDGEFRYAGRPIPALQGLDPSGRTLYVGTFSKVLFPALRLGYVILPSSLVAPFVGLRWLSDRHSATQQQQVLAAFIGEGHYERHLRRMRKRYETKRRILIDALTEAFGAEIELHGTNAGVHLLVWFKDPVLAKDESRLIESARRAGVGIYPVSPLYQTPTKHLGLLFGYSGISESGIVPGIALLRQVLMKRP
ncbi:PLP-dependent aminotransferase family protein [Sedimenticola sp.]|uniref:MocR-like pyridoxine biosynthesis transcription factor PdxR n=1 Tax=Sedimenticola sp. TaxID=1940285 RepID=UPI003D0B662D